MLPMMLFGRGRDTVWKLVLTPSGKEHQGFVSLMLHYLGPADRREADPVKATVEFSLLNAVGAKGTPAFRFCHITTFF